MDKFYQRKLNEKALAQKRFSSVLLFTLVFFVQVALLILSSQYERLTYCVILCIFFDFFTGLKYFYRELFIQQMRDALSDMESEIRIGRPVYHHLPINPIAGSSYIWESIRARVLYRYRYHRKSFDVNFLLPRTDDPTQCAWAAAWFYANDDLKGLQNDLPILPIAKISSYHNDLIRFTLALGKYGYLHDFISDISWEDWLHDHQSFYSAIPELLALFDDSGLDT